MPITKRNCPHCNAPNEVTTIFRRNYAVYCRVCSHRVDVAKDQCNCLRCEAERGQLTNNYAKKRATQK